jgi:hypothetical protein
VLTVVQVSIAVTSCSKAASVTAQDASLVKFATIAAVPVTGWPAGMNALPPKV